MKKTLNKLLRRNIFSNFKQFLSIIAIVFLSMTLLSGFIVNSTTLENTINNYFADTNLADAWLYVDNITAEDEGFYVENEINFEKRLELNTVASIKDSTAQKNSKIFVYDTGKISTPYITSGIEGCFIDESVVKNNNLKVGRDKILFDYDYSIAGQIITLNFEFLINGTMCLSECADTYSTWPILIDKEVFLEQLNSLINFSAMADIITENISYLPYNQILIKSNNVDEDLIKIKEYYKNQSCSNLVLALKQDSIDSVVMLESEVSQSRKMIYIFPVIFMLVSVLVIITSISQLILQEKTKIGTLKSLGASSNDLLRHYSSYGFVLCLIGSLAGLIVGPILIPEIMFVKYDLVYSIPRDYVSLNIPWLVLLGVLVAICLMGYLVAFLTCREITSKKPAQCLKPDVKLNLKSKNKTKKINLPLPIKMAFRNIRLKPIRTIMAAVGVAGCVALMLCGFGISDTLEHSLANDLGGVFDYDISSTYETADFVQKLEDFSEIKYYETYEQYYAEVSANESSKTISIYQICENSQFVNFEILQGDTVISRSVADDLNVKIGDSIFVLNQGQGQELKVTKIIETALFNGIYVCNDLNINVNLATFGVWIDAEGNFNELVNKINQINGTNSAQSMVQIKDYAENKISSITLMTTTLKIFALALAIVVLLNLIFLILKERVREIATLKVVGKNIFEVAVAVWCEILLISIIGTIAGMFLGYPMLILVLMVNKVEIINFLYYLSPISFVFSAIIILAVIAIILMISLIKIKKINMIESLKSVE